LVKIQSKRWSEWKFWVSIWESGLSLLGGQSNQEAMCEAITSTLQYVKADFWFKKLCEPQAIKRAENTNTQDIDNEKDD
jgi:hypothetical protein